MHQLLKAQILGVAAATEEIVEATATAAVGDLSDGAPH